MLERKSKYFIFRQYNSPFEDPHLLIRCINDTDSILFDIGDLSQIPPKEILKIRYIFISHYHMDHFIGFVQLIRVFLTHPYPVIIKIYGPEGLIQKVKDSVASFSWNLLENSGFKLQLNEVHTDHLVELPAHPFYLIQDVCDSAVKIPRDEFLLTTDHYCIQYLFLDHKIPVLGYKLITKKSITFLKEFCPYPAGKWIQEVKSCLYQDKNIPIYIEDTMHSVDKLKPYFVIHPTEQYIYLTDFLYAPQKKMIDEFITGAEWLFIENHFMDQDAELAQKTYHLSSQDVREIVKKCHPHNIILFHFSRRYIGRYHIEDFLSAIEEK